MTGYLLVATIKPLITNFLSASQTIELDMASLYFIDDSRIAAFVLGGAQNRDVWDMYDGRKSQDGICTNDEPVPRALLSPVHEFE